MTNPITIAAAHAAGPCPEGGEADWMARVKRLAVDLTIADQDIGTKVELLQRIAKGHKPELGGTKGWGIVRGVLTDVTVEERSKRGLLTFQAYDRKSGQMRPETIRTNFVSDPDAAALVDLARTLIGHLVDVYKYQEEKVDGSGETVKILAHLVDRGEAPAAQRTSQAGPRPAQQPAAPQQPSAQPGPQQQAGQPAPQPQEPPQAPQQAVEPAQQPQQPQGAPQQAQAAPQQGDERIYQVNEAKTIVFEQSGSNADLAAEGWSYIGNPNQPLPHRLLARAVEYVRNKAQGTAA